MVTVTVNVRDVLDAVTPLRNPGYLLVRPFALELADPVVSGNDVQVTVPLSGVTSFTTDATPAGNALQITPLSLGESDLVWTVQVPEVSSIDLGTLIRDHSVDPASLAPVSTVPTVREELDDLDTRITDLEHGGGGSSSATIWNQTTPASTWIVAHDLARLPVVTIYVGGQVVLVQVDSTTTQVTVTFPSPQTGTLVIS
jgi:hypothetical protein